MALNFGGQTLFKESPADGEFTARVRGFFIGDTAPTINTPGDMVVWERGEGQGESYTNDNASTTMLTSANSRAGNSFTIGGITDDGDFTIASAAFRVIRIGTPGTIDVDVYAVDGNDEPTGASLSSGTFNGDSASTSNPGTVLTATMSSATLKQNTKYAIICKADDIGGGEELNFRYRNGAGTPPYEFGDELKSGDGGSTWTVDHDDTIYFDLQGGGKFLLIKMSDGDTYQAPLVKLQ